MACPICARESQRNYRPFCSARCADIDLARWLGERYVIPGKPAPDTPPDQSDAEN